MICDEKLNMSVCIEAMVSAGEWVVPIYENEAMGTFALRETVGGQGGRLLKSLGKGLLRSAGRELLWVGVQVMLFSHPP